MHIDYMDSPIGTIEIKASIHGITHLVFTDKKNSPINTCNVLNQCKIQLNEYFSGKRKSFSLPLDPKGTDFQKSIWSALVDIPFGKTVSYGDIANVINHSKAVRAVGAANGKNPISIIVPCHRVIGSNGKLTGYAWGLERKSWLLAHEELIF
ncbi:MAG: methylated-DNA--[protein]-cysteine S-methyltransferase [Porticoccus sp.]|nr:methylated-DNA--[protein]-cysteine S-methyltransferase [Porticoccus sp.]